MIESLRTVILQEFKARFSGMTWNLGSLVRTLIVEPLASIGDTLSSYIQTAENSLDVQTICKSPAQYPVAIDTWMNRLGIEQPAVRVSTGTVAILSETGQDMTVPVGTIFSWGSNLSFQTTEERIFNATTPFVKLNEGAYLAEVPVASLGESGASLSVGSPLNWQGAPSHVYDIYTSSPITGGFSELSYQAKADLILNALSVKSFVGEEGISNALRREFPIDVINAKAGQKSADKLYSVPLYVKSATPPTTFTTSLILDANQTIEFSGAGVMTIDKVLNASNEECTYSTPLITPDTPSTTIGDSDSVVRLTILSGASVGEKVTVHCTGFPILRSVSYWLNGETQGLPFKYITKIPTVAVLKLSINATDTIPLTAKTSIQEYINDKPLDAAVTDSEIAAILSQSNVVTSGSNLYSATIINTDNINAVITNVGGATLAGSVWSSGRPVAMYSYVDKITANV